MEQDLKQKQIEEMAKIICKETSNKGICQECGFREGKEIGVNRICYKFDNAIDLYNAGYRKIPEGSVVLTKEEYEKLDIVKEMYGSVDKVKVSDILKMLAMTDRVARKETAEKFAEMLKEKFAYDVERCKAVDEICEEITEGKV